MVQSRLTCNTAQFLGNSSDRSPCNTHKFQIGGAFPLLQFKRLIRLIASKRTHSADGASHETFKSWFVTVQSLQLQYVCHLGESLLKFFKFLNSVLVLKQ